MVQQPTWQGKAWPILGKGMLEGCFISRSGDIPWPSLGATAHMARQSMAYLRKGNACRLLYLKI
jgi:hypothetical protein